MDNTNSRHGADTAVTAEEKYLIRSFLAKKMVRAI